MLAKIMCISSCLFPAHHSQMNQVLHNTNFALTDAGSHMSVRGEASLGK